MRFLRTNTAVRVTVGPFLDATDGITPEVALTVTNEKLTLVVDTADVPTLVLDVAPTASGGANDMVHVHANEDAGFYDLELAAANVNYLGRAMLALTNAAVHCPVFHEFMILPANVYDSLVLGTDKLDSNVAEISEDSTAADNAEKYFDGRGFNHVLQNTTIATLTSQTVFTLAGGSSDNDAYNGALVVIEDVSTEAQKAIAIVSDYVGSTKEITLAAAPAFTIATTDKITLIAFPVIESGDTMADKVWDEAIAGHLTAGTTGNKLNAAASAGDPWSTSLPGAYGAGTAGKIIGDNINATISSRLAPTTAGRTLDVTTGGEAGIDWANIGSPTTSQNLSATTIGTLTTNSDKTGYSLTAGQLFIKKNTSLNNFMWKMVDSTDHVTPKTGLTVTCQRSIDGAAFTNCSTATATEIGSGWYKVNLAASDLNGTTIALKFTATGADQRDMLVVTQA